MTILFVSNECQTGGATKSLYYLIKNLKKMYYIKYRSIKYRGDKLWIQYWKKQGI